MIATKGCSIDDGYCRYGGTQTRRDVLDQKDEDGGSVGRRMVQMETRGGIISRREDENEGTRTRG
jgi:hypothetical protein